MTGTTTAADAPRRRGPMAILAVSLAINGSLAALLWWCEPLRRSTMTADREQMLAHEEQAKQRADERERSERDQRRERAIRPEDAPRLKAEEERKRERRLGERLVELRAKKREIAELREAKMAELAQRDASEVVQAAAGRLVPLARSIQHHAHHIFRARRDQPATADRDRADALVRHSQALEATPALDRAPARGEATALSVSALAGLASGGEGEAWTRIRDDTAAYLRELDGIDDPNGTQDGATADPPDTAPTGIEAVHDAIAALEQAVAADFADIRAAELAMLQQTAFAQAAAAISDLGTAATAPPAGFTAQQPGTVGAMNDYRAQLDQAVRSADAMAVNAGNMVAEAGRMVASAQQGQPGQQGGQGGQGQPGGQGAGAHARAAQAMRAAFQNAAAGGMGRQVDLSAAMRQQAGRNGGIAGASGGSRGGDGDGGGEGRGTGSGGLGAGQGIRNLDEVRIDGRLIKATALPGRKFTASSARSGWMFLDTWYVVGPWQATFPGGRIDYGKIHPPEVRVDLDAVYRDGKTWERGAQAGSPRELRWRFHQSSTLRTTPPDEQPDSTYYCYTEVWFDRDTDMLIAVGTDDGAKVWINDTVVWQDNGLSAWNLDEGYRKVFFKQGFNRILVRISNGPIVCQYSVLLCPPDAVKP